MVIQCTSMHMNVQVICIYIHTYFLDDCVFTVVYFQSILFIHAYMKDT